MAADHNQPRSGSELPKQRKDKTMRRGSKWALLATMCLALGCAKPGGSGSVQHVLFRPPIASLELLQSALEGGDDPRWPRPPDKRGDLLARWWSVFADDQGFGRKAMGRDYFLLVQRGAGIGTPPGLAVFDLSGNKIGEVTGFSVPAGIDSWWMHAEWDPEGRRVAVSFLEQGGEWLCVLGVVEPPATEFRELLRENESDGWQRAIWAKERLIVVYWDRVVEVETGDGTTKQLYAEDVRKTGYGDIGVALPSRDGSLLVFDRRPCWHHGQFGLWALDLGDGECREVTYEQAETYTHTVLHWESDAAMLLSRVRADGRWDIYRAHFSVPPGQ